VASKGDVRKPLWRQWYIRDDDHATSESWSTSCQERMNEAKSTGGGFGGLGDPQLREERGKIRLDAGTTREQLLSQQIEFSPTPPPLILLVIIQVKKSNGTKHSFRGLTFAFYIDYYTYHCCYGYGIDNGCSLTNEWIQRY
jgi:hypothetical protein